MRKISLLLGLFLSMSTLSFATEPVVQETDVVSKNITIQGIQSSTFNVVRFVDNNGVFLKLVDNQGKELWKSIPLGIKPWNFVIDDKSSSFEVMDIDGDNAPELITACTIGDIQSALYIFKYNKEKKCHEPMNFGYIGYEDMTRDFMVSDIPAEGKNIIFENKTTVRCLGKIYTENGPVPGFYYFKLTDGQFMTGDPIPVAKDVTPPESTKPEVIEQIPPSPDDSSEKG